MSNLYFCLTAGRTGSQWLADFLTANLGFEAMHEPLEIADFGTRMPDVRLMRSFNTYGMNEEVQSFWQSKLDALPTDRPYAETNHTLGKCGLIEALATHERGKDATVFVLRRNLAKQCASYIARNDFTNITLLWQWYLAPEYKNVIVSPEELRKLGSAGLALWYCMEMECRQVYYERLYRDQLKLVSLQLEELSTPEAARALLEEIGHPRRPLLPGKTNVHRGDKKDELVEEISAILQRQNFNPERLVDDYIAMGGRLQLSKAA